MERETTRVAFGHYAIEGQTHMELGWNGTLNPTLFLYKPVFFSRSMLFFSVALSGISWLSLS